MEEELTQLREYWLRHAAAFLIEHMQRCGLVPVVVRVSCGWPSRGGLGQRQAVIGQCFGPQACADGVPQTFVSPRLAENVEVLGVLLHELVHASVGVQHKHLAPFSQAARKVGLVGPPTATVVGPALRLLFQEYVTQVGVYPHAVIVPHVKGNVGSRLRLYQSRAATGERGQPECVRASGQEPGRLNGIVAQVRCSSEYLWS